MGKLPRMDEGQFRRVKKLIRRLCANCDSGNCLLLDDGDPCPQMVSPTLICKYFRAAVLPADRELCAEVLGGIHSWKRCPACALRERRRRDRERKAKAAPHFRK